MTSQNTIRAYYHAWTTSEFESARAMLDPGLRFKSPDNEYHSADEYLNNCWKYAETFKEVDWLHEVYGSDSAYIVYRLNGFVIGELITLKNEKITSIFVSYEPTH